MTVSISFPLSFYLKSSSESGILAEREANFFDSKIGYFGFDLPNWCIVLALIIGTLVFIESVFFWTPSLIELTTNKGKGKMIWSKKRYGFIERVFCYEFKNTQIIIRRKRSSFRGLLMQEFNIEIYLPSEDPRVQKISNFTGIQKIIETKKYNILKKGVDLKYLPLQFVQIQAMLALP
jgi:hypothetical protein